MASQYPINPDFKSIGRVSFMKNRFIVSILNALIKADFALKGPGEGITQTKYKIRSYDCKMISVYVFCPAKVSSKNLPCVLYNHGGGFILRAMGYQKQDACRIAEELNCVVIFPDYRLLPGHPFPAAVEDCYRALLWTDENAEKLGINRNNIGVLGSSAGGCISAALTLMTRDRNGPPLKFQILKFPAVDVDMKTESMKKYYDTPNWDSELNYYMWKSYLSNGDFGMPEYASPMKSKNFSGIPQAYIETAEFDCLRDEGIEYAELLRQSGVRVVLRNTEGTVHGFDRVVLSPITQESLKARMDFMRDAINNFVNNALEIRL